MNQRDYTWMSIVGDEGVFETKKYVTVLYTLSTILTKCTISYEKGF